MYKFIIYRGFEYLFSFLYVILGYQLLNVEQGLLFYDFVLITTILTFSFSNANNWLMKSEDQSAYVQFQLLVAVILAGAMLGIGKLEYVIYIPIMLLKSFSIVQLRLDHKELIIPKFSMLFGLLNLIVIYMISISTLHYSNIYFFITNAITAFLLYSNLNLKIRFSRLSLSRITDILKYLPVVGSSFLTLNIDRFLVKEILTPTELLIYAQYEVVSQGVVMFLLTVLFYYHKKILIDQKIRDNFKKLDRYLYPVTIIFVSLSGILTLCLSEYLGLNFEFVLPLFIFKFTALLVSYYVVFSQTEDKESAFCSYVVLIYVLIFIVCLHQFIPLTLAAFSSLVLILGNRIIAKRI
jgi:hypothetical protein